MTEVKYYICSYDDYNFERLPSTVNIKGETIKGLTKSKKLSKAHTIGHERQSLDGTKFITWCGDDAKCKGSLSWMKGNEPEYTHAEILEVLRGSEWFDPEALLH